MRSYLLLLFTMASVFITFTSCESQEDIRIQNWTESQNTDFRFKTLENAISEATRTFELVYGKKRGDLLSVKNVEFLSNNRTKTSEDDGYYIINYGEDDGFAIVSTDNRRPISVYSISDEGSVHLSDTINNAGLKWYIGDVLMQSDYTPEPIDTVIHGFEPIEEDITYVKRPLITGFMSKFHQFDPYNRYCRTADGKRAAIGCGPLAVGTVVGYYRWPTIISGYTINWDAMATIATHSGWSRLFELMGRSDYCQSTYGETLTTSVADFMTNAFQSLGYKGASYSIFDELKLIQSLQESNPVIVSSTTHIWIIDGAFILTKNNPAIEGNPKEQYTYYHCIWGNEGKANGYFMYDYPRMGGVPKNPDYNNTYSEDYYYHLKMCYGFKPNK